MPSLLCVSVHRFKLGHAGVTKFTVENVMEASCYVHVLTGKFTQATLVTHKYVEYDCILML